MKEILKRGATSNILRVFLPDSASTTGAGKTGLTNSSTGLIISTIADVEATATTYTSAASNVETITTLGTFAAPTTGKARFKEVDATNFPGLYEIQIADARFSVANTTALVVSVQCTGVAPTFAEIQLVTVDLYDTVRFGLTALPNVASGSAGAIITSGTGTAQLSTTSGNVTVGTNNDKTGYSLTQSFPSNFSSLAITAGGAVTAGTVSDKTGYSLSQSFPANFASLAITAGGAVTAGTVSDKTGYSLASSAITSSTFASGAITAASIATDAITSAELSSSAINEIVDGVWLANGNTQSDGTTLWPDPSMGARSLKAVAGANYDVTMTPNGPYTVVAEVLSTPKSDIADAVWDETTSGHTTAGTYGGRVLRATNSNVEVQVTGSNHVAADVHEFQPGVITAADFSSGAIDANALAASAAGEIADAVWDEQLSGHLTAGSTGEALNDAGGAGQGATTVRMGPFTVKAEGQASDLPLDINKGATHGIDCKLVDAQGTGVDLTGATLSTKVYSTSGALVATISGTATYEAGGDMTWTIPTSVTNTSGTYTATITRTTGASDTEVFGPLRIYVRDI